jgi:hypothetical protein
MPRAKQRLALEGPMDAGRGAFRDAVLIVAAELRLHDVPEDDAVSACQAIPFAADSTPRHKVLKSVRDFVRFAYNPPRREAASHWLPFGPLSLGRTRSQQAARTLQALVRK